MKRIVWFICVMAVITMSAVAQVPKSNHVVVVMEENNSFSGVIGNSAMPYLNSLASKYGLATQYYANTHPSIGNYFEMTTGQILTNDDSQTPSTFPVSSDNIVRQLLTAGKTWKSYAEDLPSVGYTGGDSGNYAVRHNPFAYFTDVQNSGGQKLNLVPFSQFATDLNNNQLPDFSYIVPNLSNDGHDGTLQQADTWLQRNIAPLLASAAFQNDGLLIITFDESVATDTAHGGGKVATLVIGPTAKLGYKSATFYQHQNLLRTILAALGVINFPGSAASVPAMTDFFNDGVTAQASTTPSTSQATTTSGVTISSPANGATVSSPARIVASAVSSNSYPITAMRVYVDNTSAYTVNAANLDTTLVLSAGSHNLTVVAWDGSGKAYTKSITVAVASSAAPAGVTISSPASGATVSSPVRFTASAASSSSAYPITAMRIYVDNNAMYTTSSGTLNTSLALAAGAHDATIVAWDASGKAYTNSVAFAVGGGTMGSVTIASPGNGATVSSPVQFVASAQANSGYTITAMRVYVDNNSTYTVNAANLSTSLALVNGTHNVVVQAWDNAGTVYRSAETITVSAPSVTPVVHYVTLNWKASTSAGVIGYNIYRGTQNGGSYLKLTSAPITGTSFTDNNVSSGVTYYYVATAVSGSGTESAYSTSANAIIPNP